MRRETGLREPVCLIRRWAVRTCSAMVYDDYSSSLSSACCLLPGTRCCRQITNATCKYVQVSRAVLTRGIDLAGD